MSEQNISRTKRSSQAIDNFSFDEDFLVKVVELVKRNQAGTAIEYFNPATEETQLLVKSAIENITIPAPAGGATASNQDTLISLIETLQELNQRLAPLAGAMASTAQLRTIGVVSGTVTATGGGYITSAQSIAEKAVGGVMYEQRVAIANLTAVESNINNVSVT